MTGFGGFTGGRKKRLKDGGIGGGENTVSGGVCKSGGLGSGRSVGSGGTTVFGGDFRLGASGAAVVTTVRW